MSDARLQHELDLRTRECQEWKMRAEKAEAERADLAARLVACNEKVIDLRARLNAATKVIKEIKECPVTMSVTYTPQLRDELIAFDILTGVKQ